MCIRAVVEVDYFFSFFRDQGADSATSPHRGDKQVIPKHVEFLLIVARRVGGAGETIEVYE